MTNTESMKRLAELVYPDKPWVVLPRPLMMADTICNSIERDSDGDLIACGEYFSPSITGEEWQQAQALRIIVAAFELGHTVKLGKYKDEYWLDWLMQSSVEPMRSNSKCTKACPDILQAAIHALLGREG